VTNYEALIGLLKTAIELIEASIIKATRSFGYNGKWSLITLYLSLLYVITMIGDYWMGIGIFAALRLAVIAAGFLAFRATKDMNFSRKMEAQYRQLLELLKKK